MLPWSVKAVRYSISSRPRPPANRDEAPASFAIIWSGHSVTVSEGRAYPAYQTSRTSSRANVDVAGDRARHGRAARPSKPVEENRNC